MFERLGKSTGTKPVLWITGWILCLGLLVWCCPSADELASHEPKSVLPATEPFNTALEFERNAFPEMASRTRTVLIFEAKEGINEEQSEYLRNLSLQLVNEYAPKYNWSVQSPFIQAYLESRLFASDGCAAMIVVSSDTNYLTLRSVTHVELLEELVRKSLPPGLKFEVTGAGGLGRDLAQAAEEAHKRTTIVTLIALIVILAIVYRAPVAAMVPLGAIGLSVVVAIMILNQLIRLGWSIGTFEKTITVVLLFGSGTDFALFWLAAFREELSVASSRIGASAVATRRTGPAIVTSAATTVCGLLMLVVADLLPSANAGKALAVALAVSLAASLTLVPALAFVLGRCLFWPRRTIPAAQMLEKSKWTPIARWVSARPLGAALTCLVICVCPFWYGWTADYTYDALGVIPANSGTARGEAIAQTHFSAEQLFSWTMIVEDQNGLPGFSKAISRSAEISRKLMEVPGIVDIWSLANPLGIKNNSVTAMLAGTDLGRKKAEPFYFSPDHQALRLEIMNGNAPFSDQAIESYDKAVTAVRNFVGSEKDNGIRIHATGLTPYIVNIKEVAAEDHETVVALVIIVIFLIVLGLIREPVLAVSMLLATMLVYFVSLGVTEWFFVTVMGHDGIDWKVRLFAFVILVAVGQDYNIFLVSRLLQERAGFPPRLAAQRAIAGTGAVISGCGAIMAATLGSLAASGLIFLQELGMAFAVGVLVDTFLIRPVLVPAVYILLHRSEKHSTNKSAPEE